MANPVTCNDPKESCGKVLGVDPRSRKERIFTRLAILTYQDEADGKTKAKSEWVSQCEACHLEMLTREMRKIGVMID